VRKLIVLSLFVCVVPVAVCQQNSVLAGHPGLTYVQLRNHLGQAGQVVEISNGYYRIEATAGFGLPEIARRLKDKVQVLLPGSANLVDQNDLFSVQDHIRYINGAFLIRHGRLPRSSEITGAERYEATEYFLLSRANPSTGKLNTDAYRAAVAHRSRMLSATPDMINPGQVGAAAPVAWAYVGPRKLGTPQQSGFGQHTLSGRKNSIAIPTSAGNTYYVGSANGGVWKTTDGGATFQPLSDSWPMMSVTGLAVDPTDANVVYAGTGDHYGTGQQSFGIMKTVDGGSTWTNLGQSEFGDSVVTRIKTVPGAPSIVLALTAGPSGDIWRSTDSGQSWARTDAPDADWQDIDVRPNGTFVAVSPTAGIYRSTGNGANWVPVNSPVAPSASRVDIAVSKTDNLRFYFVTSNQQVFRTINGGSTWTNVTPFHDAATTDPNLNWSSAASAMFVETAAGTGPEGFDVVYIGLRTLTVTDDNGLNWADVTESNDPTAKVHAGQMCYVPDPLDPAKGLLGGEGGLYAMTYSNPSNSATFQGLNDTIFDVQFNTVTVHPSNTTQVMGGAVGNATPASRADLQQWSNLFAGSGAGVAFDLAAPGIHYTGSQNGGVYRYTFASDPTPDDISLGGGLLVAPLITSGINGSTPTLGLANGDVATFDGTNWTALATGGGAIRTLARSRFDTNRIYTGALNGDIYRAGSLGGAFNRVDGGILPDRPIGGIAESPYTADSILVGLQGVGFNNNVYRSPNASLGSPSWTNVSGTGIYALPPVPVNDVEFDPFTNVYYAATDIGIFVSPDSGIRWFNMNTMGLPNIGVTDLWLHSNGGSNFLYAATYGRGIWRCFLSQRFLTQVQIAKTAIYGGQQNIVTLRLNGAAPAGTAAIVTDDSPNVSVTPLVEFPIGATAASFTTFSINPAADQTVTISARVFGTTTTGSFVMHAIPAFTYTANTDIYGGDRINAVIDFTIPAPIAAVFTFADNSSFVSSPTATSLAQGQQTKAVNLFTLPVTTATPVLISARLANTLGSTTVTLHPKPTLDSLMLNPSTVQGGNPVTGTFGLTFAGAGGDLTVSVSDTSAAVGTPASVTIPQGNVTQDFGISTNVVTSSFTVTVRGTLNGVSRTATLNVHP